MNFKNFFNKTQFKIIGKLIKERARLKKELSDCRHELEAEKLKNFWKSLR